MKISKFSLGSADSDGEMSCEVELSVANPTREIVRLLTTNSVVLNPKGFPVSFSRDDTEACAIDPKESHQFEVRPSRVPAALAGNDRTQVSLVVSNTLQARDYSNLGEIDVPQSELGWTTLERAVASHVIESPIRVLVRRGEDSDDGTTSLEWRASLRSVTDLHIASAQLKCELLDREGFAMESSDASVAIDAGAVACIHDSFWSIRRNKLKGAKLKFTISVFRPVLTETCSMSGAQAAD